MWIALLGADSVFNPVPTHNTTQHTNNRTAQRVVQRRSLPASEYCFRCGFKRDGPGYIATVQTHIPQYRVQHQHQFVQNQNGNNVRGTGNVAGHSGVQVSQAQVAMSNKGRTNMQEDQHLAADSMQVLTQVLQLLQSLLLDPHAKEHLQVSLKGHVEPLLEPKKSTAELIVENETLRSQQSNAQASKKGRVCQMLANAQVVAEKMNVIREGVVVLKGELQALRTELLQPGPPLQPKPEHVHVHSGAPGEFCGSRRNSFGSIEHGRSWC